MDILIKHLKELGFNSYEAKVYVALLKNNPSTGYEVSKNSGVPQARAYDTLKALETQKIIVSTGGKPQMYMPIKPKEILNRYKNKIETSIDYLEENLPSLSDDYIEPIVNLRDEKSIKEQIANLIQNAEREIFVEIWDEDFQTYRQKFKDAYDRGVDIKIVGYNNLQSDFGLIYQHGLGDKIEENLGGRWIVLSVDNEEGMVGTISDKENHPNCVYTKNKGLVFIIKEVAVHDMYLRDVQSKLGKSLEDIYGKDMIILRDKILGKNFHFSSH